jgi:hypothetical protein
MTDGELVALMRWHQEAPARARQALMKLGWLLVFLAALFAATQLLACPQAGAYPACDGGYQVGTPWGGYCDGIPETTGQHWHCQWGYGFSLCEWRWADNTPAPNPYLPAGPVVLK